MTSLQNQLPARTTIPIPKSWILYFCIATFFYWTALYLYQPILSVYAESIGASLSLVGIIVASYALPQFLFRMPLGVWYDTRVYKKPFIAAGIILTCIGAIGLGLAPNPWWLFGARTVTGFGAAAWVAFTTYFAAYYSTPGEIKRAISVINFVQGAAMVAAVYSGGMIAQHFNYTFTFYGAAILALFALIFLFFAGHPVVVKRDAFSWGSLKVAISYKPLLMVSLMGVLSQFANWAGLFGFVPVYAAGIGATSADLGTLNTLALGASAISSLLVVRFIKNWGNSFTIFAGAILIGGAIAVVPLIHTIMVLKVVMIFNGLGRGLLTTILMLLSIQGVRPEQRATSMGIFQALYALGMLLGPLVSGFMAERWGLSSAFYLSTLCCLVTAAIAYFPIVRRLNQE